jgi:PTH1 family peptidyl-tRNA hydrolase
MKLIIGLGNPGKQYENTRHNAGFMMVDKIKENYNFPDFEFNKKFDANVSVGNANLRSTDEKIILAKPQTFMNNSGNSVRAILDFYKLTPKDIIVIHDDIDLTLGKYKITDDSGSAGHNGVQDIIDKIDTKDFKRIRIGIANENLRSVIDPADFVLQKFSEEELEIIENISGEIIEEIGKLL